MGTHGMVSAALLVTTKRLRRFETVCFLLKKKRLNRELMGTKPCFFSKKNCHNLSSVTFAKIFVKKAKVPRQTHRKAAEAEVEVRVHLNDANLPLRAIFHRRVQSVV